MRPGWGGALSFADETGDQYEVSLGFDGAAVVMITRPTLFGWREGTARSAREVANPAARAALLRIE